MDVHNAFLHGKVDEEVYLTPPPSYCFIQSQADHSLFTLITATSLAIVLVYVDDILVAGNDISQVSYFKSIISTHFKTKDLGPLKYFLGLEVAPSPSCIFLNKQKYALDILADSGQLGFRPTPFPMEQSLKLNDTDGDSLPDPAPRASTLLNMPPQTKVRFTDHQFGVKKQEACTCQSFGEEIR
ncbi:hypothetical protein F2P56_030048 [Juglans regia]|uniref:Reverse transcriptase Ty1/copia-type domain-containing protein n=1 Tax=Juglans regia TaxID=51240 RepID=A0A833U3N6_JUGRE|nr:hypothetical protein F2P56_030048 [Juglans regia]